MPTSRSIQATPSLLDETSARIAQVASVALLRPIDKPYSYIVPDDLVQSVHPGMRVSVPFGRGDRPTPAFCLSVSPEPWKSTLKPILSCIDDSPVLNTRLLSLGRWIATYYAAYLGRTLDLMIPAAAKRRAGTRRIRYAELDPAAEALLKDTGARLSERQRTILELLSAAAAPLRIDELVAKAGCTPAVIRTLEKRSLIRVETRSEYDATPAPAGIQDEPTFELNEDQQTAASQIGAAIESKSFSVQVLFGVTGSGKTEVYVAAIRRALAGGKQAIMLVPEIALTTQTVQRLKRRFERVATIHSAMTEASRSKTWAAVRSGEIQVVIGTRSAVFAPCPNLGVIIVDEEAEPSYKSQQSPRYHTRDVAVIRGHIEEIPVVLGSATPSLETWLNVRRRKHYHLIRMPNRVRGLAMPKMHLVDMNEEHRARPGVHMLSIKMEKLLAETLERGEQAVVLLNRRGYASFLHCAKCRNVLSCPHCAVRLVFHQTTRLAHCHYCHKTLTVPTHCQNLGCDGKMVKFGLGTQRVEEELGRRFTSARIRRIDSDVMQKASDYAELLGAFERREFDILVGTQMVAKGLDFPFVSFVGVVSADTALALDDFRSEERTFQLVLQVAGRSGRGDAAGTVVVQTFAADTAPIRHAIEGDYEGFAQSELASRQQAGLPPFTRMVRIILADARISKLKQAAEAMAVQIRELLKKYKIAVDVFEPRPSNISRLRDLYRYDLILVFRDADALLRAVAVLKDENALRAGVKSVTVDVDPVSLQ